VKRIRREEAEKAAVLLGVTIELLDGGDYPLRPTEAMMDAVLQAMRLRQPATILCHSTADPYNVDHPRAAEVTIEARILAQAHGV
jgi:4-oxalomesaconate hydratase